MARNTTRPRTPRAQWEVVEDKPGLPLVIRDVGVAMTITNDAEAVVAWLHADGKLRNGRRIFYYDSLGDLDEIVHDNGCFVGFRVAPTREGE